MPPKTFRDVVWLWIQEHIDVWGASPDRGEAVAGLEFSADNFVQIMTEMMESDGSQTPDDVVAHVRHYAELRPELVEPILATYAVSSAPGGPSLTLTITTSGPDIVIERSTGLQGSALALTVRGLTPEELAD